MCVRGKNINLRQEGTMDDLEFGVMTDEPETLNFDDVEFSVLTDEETLNFDEVEFSVLDD